MGLSALPAELKLHVAGYLDPESTFHFALTSKEHASTCKSILQEHAIRLADGQVLDTDRGVTLSWRFLKDVLHEPSLGWYVRELNLPPNRQVSWIEDGEDGVPSEEELKLFNEAARQLQDLYGPTTRFTGMEARYGFRGEPSNPNDMVATIQERISQGYDDGIIAVLLHHLPFLRTIRITDTDTSGLQIFLRRLADEYQNPNRSPHLPLRHLKTAAVAHWDTEMGCKADWAASFCTIPSLETFAAKQMADGCNFVTKDNFPEGYIPTSNVTELFLYGCQLDVENGLVPILANIKNLKKFTYSGGGCIVSDSASMNPKSVIKELVKYAAHSLEELTLDQGDLGQDLSDEMDIPTISLLPFQRLRILNCEYELLRPLDNADDASDDNEPLESGFHTADENTSIDDAWDVRTILPSSLEELYLHGRFDNDDGAYDEWEQIKDLFSTPSPGLPKLTEEKTCIRRRRYAYGDDVIGMAEAPAALYEAPLVVRLFEGHEW